MADRLDGGASQVRVGVTRYDAQRDHAAVDSKDALESEAAPTAERDPRFHDFRDRNYLAKKRASFSACSFVSLLISIAREICDTVPSV